MIPVYSLVFPLLIAFAWRYLRGEGKIRRVFFYALMWSMAYLTSFDVRFSAGFLAFVLGVGMPPHNGLFSATHGRAPGRDDPWGWRWMQTLVFMFHKRPSLDLGPEPARKYWMSYGVYYGAVRALATLPGIAYLVGYTHSLIPLVGLISFAEGYLYYLSGRIRDYYQMREDLVTVIAEPWVGEMVGVYMLITAACMQ